jgi:hypothetical protein
MAANLKRLEEPSHALFQAGHVPMIGEWVALPIWHAAGGKSMQATRALYEQIFHPVAGMIACFSFATGVLRLEGASLRKARL